jgi:hypothetical protein
MIFLLSLYGSMLSVLKTSRISLPDICRAITSRPNQNKVLLDAILQSIPGFECKTLENPNLQHLPLWTDK